MIENHGGISGDPDAVVQIIKASGNLVRTAPDFGNFKPAIRYEGLAKLMPYAIAVHAKLFEFDANGDEIALRPAAVHADRQGCQVDRPAVDRVRRPHRRARQGG